MAAPRVSVPRYTRSGSPPGVYIAIIQADDATARSSDTARTDRAEPRRAHRTASTASGHNR